MCSGSRDVFKLWEISDNISGTVKEITVWIFAVSVVLRSRCRPYKHRFSQACFRGKLPPPGNRQLPPEIFCKLQFLERVIPYVAEETLRTDMRVLILISTVRLHVMWVDHSFMKPLPFSERNVSIPPHFSQYIGFLCRSPSPVAQLSVL